MIDQLTESMLAPFLSQIGWQGFAYGLLGLKMVRKLTETGREIVLDRNNDNDSEMIYDN